VFLLPSRAHSNSRGQAGLHACACAILCGEAIHSSGSVDFNPSVFTGSDTSKSGSEK
jgi:hypothetical protein